ncbi:MAG: response regulator [Acidobacteria bacterium]|nr:response regulator [Acidobacteriota bacterium]
MQIKRRIIRSQLAATPINPEPEKQLALVADDDWVSREVVCAILERQGYECIRAKSGHETRALLYRHHPGLMILDLNMPLGGGLDVLSTLKQAPPQKPVKTMILTGSSDTEDIQLAASLGATNYMTKPLVTAEFITRIHAMEAAAS